MSDLADFISLEPEGRIFLGLSTTALHVGETLVITPIFTGADREDYICNYVWNRNDSWEVGEFDSTVEHYGHCMPIYEQIFVPDRPGRYRIGMDIESKSGDFYSNMERWVHVAEANTFLRPPIPDDDAEPAVTVDDVSMVFNSATEQFNSLKEYFIALARHELKFKEFRALNDISFEVKRGEAFGLVGTNGSGKSTMLKIIAGVLDPTEGACKVYGTIAPLIELGAGFDMELTARENIYLNGALLGYRREFVEENFDRIIEFAELQDFMDMPLKNYSSGMVARIAFAIATITEPDILIVDETLSVGDYLFQQKCEQRIRELIESSNVTVLLVSHDIGLVERICDRVAWIEKGHLRMVGPTDDVTNAYRNLER